MSVRSNLRRESYPHSLQRGVEMTEPKFKMPDFDDKDLVILAVTVLTILAMVIMKVEAKDIVMSSLTGLFGIAVGKTIK